MFPSLGYVTELEQAAERGKSEIRSKVDFGQQDARHAARAAFPDANSITLHGEPTAGAGGVTSVFSTDNRESKYVLKAASEEMADQLQKGTAMYRYLSDQMNVPVPVPEVHTVQSTVPGFSYPYTIVEHVRGDELSSIAQFKSFPRERQKTLIREMGRVLGRLHERTEFESYGPLSVQTNDDLTVDDGLSDWRDHYLSTYEEYAAAAGDSPVGDLAVRAWKFFERKSDDVCPPDGPVLLHADFTPDNLITKQGTVRAVLDWELARAGSSAKELWDVEENVVRIFQTDDARREFRDALYEGYREHRPLSERFLGLKSLFAVAEFTKVGNVHSVVADVNSDLDSSNFRARAERELDSRIETAEARLEQII